MRISFGEEMIPHHQEVHIRAHETSISVLGGVYDGLPPDVEAGVDQHRATRLIPESFEETPKSRM